MGTSGGSSLVILRGGCHSLGGLWWYLVDDGRAEQLTAQVLELADGDGRHDDATPASTGSVQHCPHESEAGPLAGKPADHLDPPAGLAEGALDEVGVADAGVVAGGEPQVGGEAGE